MSGSKPGEVTRLLESWGVGSVTALDELMPLVYSELRTIAAGQLRRECSDHTLQATALVNEAFLRLVDQNRVQLLRLLTPISLHLNLAAFFSNYAAEAVRN